MAISYNKLWKLLIDHKMNKSDLGKAAKMSPNTIAKLGKNETVSLDMPVVVAAPKMLFDRNKTIYPLEAISSLSLLIIL